VDGENQPDCSWQRFGPEWGWGAFLFREPMLLIRKTATTQKTATSRRRKAIMLAPTVAEHRLIQDAAALAERPVATYALRAAVRTARADIAAAEGADPEHVAGSITQRAIAAAAGAEKDGA